MSDVSQGPGWWQASDGKWYAPELHPGYQAPTEAVAETPSEPGPEPEPAAPEPTQVVPTTPEPEPTQVVPPVGPTFAAPVGPPGGPPPGGPVGPPPGTPNHWGKIIAAVVVAIALVAGLLLFLVNRDDNKSVSASSSSSSSSSSKSSSSSSKTTTTKSSSSSSATSSSGSSTSSAAAKAMLLKAADVHPSFTDQEYSPTVGTKAVCGNAAADVQVPPGVLVGTRMLNPDGLTVVEELRVYNSPTDAKKAFGLAKVAAGCPEAFDSSFSVSQPTDVTASVGADEAFAVNASSVDGDVVIVAARKGNAIVSLQHVAPNGSDMSTVPDPISITKLAVQKVR